MLRGVEEAGEREKNGESRQQWLSSPLCFVACCELLLHPLHASVDPSKTMSPRKLSPLLLFVRYKVTAEGKKKYNII